MNDFRLRKKFRYDRGEPLSMIIDGDIISAYEGETIGAVMLAEGRTTIRHTACHDVPRGIYCGIGLCYDCLIKVDGAESLRACVTPVASGMVVETSMTEHASTADSAEVTHEH